ncbi:MAG: YhbY family RNA-binding protein [Clostridia bacterium]|nr:YhbY family RNA-binding protein [Clostridia bacterium]
MVTTKQRAYLRSLANTIEPTTQIGKLGIGDTVLKTVSLALEAHELIKLTILETCPETPKEAMVTLCDALNCEAVQVIGRKVVIYRQSSKEENRKIVLPRK